MAIVTKKSEPPRHAEDLDGPKQALAHLEALTKRRHRLREAMIQRDGQGCSYGETDASKRIANTTAALLENPEAVPPPLRAAGTTLDEEIRAVDEAIELCGHRRLQVMREAANTIWEEDFAPADRETRKRQFALLVEVGQLERERQQRIETARNHGALPGRLSEMPWLNCAISANLPKAIKNLAAYLPDFIRNNKPLAK